MTVCWFIDNNDNNNKVHSVNNEVNNKVNTGHRRRHSVNVEVQLLITIASLAQLLLFVRLISQRPLIVLITISY